MQVEKNNTYLTKQKLLQRLAKKTGLSKKSINTVFVELLDIIQEHISDSGPGKFVLPGIFKLTTKDIPSQEERVGLNPFTKKEMVFKAKPAAKKLKIKALKNLKDIVK